MITSLLFLTGCGVGLAILVVGMLIGSHITRRGYYDAGRRDMLREMDALTAAPYARPIRPLPRPGQTKPNPCNN